MFLIQAADYAARLAFLLCLTIIGVLSVLAVAVALLSIVPALAVLAVYGAVYDAMARVGMRIDRAFLSIYPAAPTALYVIPEAIPVPVALEYGVTFDDDMGIAGEYPVVYGDDDAPVTVAPVVIAPVKVKRSPATGPVKVAANKPVALPAAKAAPLSWKAIIETDSKEELVMLARAAGIKGANSRWTVNTLRERLKPFCG